MGTVIVVLQDGCENIMAATKNSLTLVSGLEEVQVVWALLCSVAFRLS